MRKKEKEQEQARLRCDCYCCLPLRLCFRLEAVRRNARLDNAESSDESDEEDLIKIVGKATAGGKSFMSTTSTSPTKGAELLLSYCHQLY